MTPEQRRAHARMASLPRFVNNASERAEQARIAAEMTHRDRGQRTRILRGVSFKHTTPEFGQR
jgi:hypothetical protein